MGTIPRRSSLAASPTIHPHIRGDHAKVIIATFILPLHPHIRGDYTCRYSSEASIQPSPPHTWGLLPNPRLSWKQCPFTPTYVGTTFHRCAEKKPTFLHPHIRGDYQSVDAAAQVMSPSPPHTWGLRDQPRRSGRRFAFTPTYVGTTTGRGGRRLLRPLHPHIRGDYWRPF